jgi:hypothetical protein
MPIVPTDGRQVNEARALAGVVERQVRAGVEALQQERA